MCLQLKVSDSPVKTIHLSTGQMLSKAFLHLSVAEQAGKKPPGIQLLPIAAFTKHFVSHCHNTNFPCSRTKGVQSLEQLGPAVDILSANPLKDDCPAHHLENTQEGPLWRTAQVLSRFYLCLRSTLFNSARQQSAWWAFFLTKTPNPDPTALEELSLQIAEQFPPLRKPCAVQLGRPWPCGYSHSD